MDISTLAFQVNDVEEDSLAINGSNGNGNGSHAEPTPLSFADMLDSFDYVVPQQGEFLEGTIIRIDEDAIFVNVGAKRDAIIPHTDLDQMEEEQLTDLSTGDVIPVYVLRTPVGDEELIVSLYKGLQQRDWDWAESCLESEELLELKVVGHNKGGLLVEFGRLRGFVPNSHVSDLRHVRNPSQRKAFKDKSRHDDLVVKVIEVDRDRRRLVMSESAAMVEQRQNRLEELEEGTIMTGRIVNVVKYGAFVDLGGVHGLLHISKIDWHHIDHPSNVFEVGDEVEVLIDEVDVKKERVSLNRKVLMPTPWDAFAEEHAVGGLIEGEITNVLDFGAFVQVADGIEGLIHISEINMPHAGSPEAVLQSRDVVLARIISIEPERERLSLSLRRVTTTEELDWMARKAEAETAEATVAETEEEVEAVAAETDSVEDVDVEDVDVADVDVEDVDVEDVDVEDVDVEDVDVEDVDVADVDAVGVNETSLTAEVEETEAEAAIDAETEAELKAETDSKVEAEEMETETTSELAVETESDTNAETASAVEEDAEAEEVEPEADAEIEAEVELEAV